MTSAPMVGGWRSSWSGVKVMVACSLRRRLLPVLFLVVSVLALAPDASASSAGMWRRTANLDGARLGHSVTALPDGTVLVVGNHRDSYEHGAFDASRVEVFDPTSGVVSASAPLRYGRGYHGAARLADGVVLVFGGVDADGDRVAVAERYDVVTRTWSTAGRTAHQRSEMLSTVLADGRVLLVGGTDSEYNPKPAEIYDPVTNSWSRAAAPSWAHLSGTLTTLHDGTALLVGGGDERDWDGDTYVERFDPSTGTWRMVAPLPRRQWGHNAARLPDGRVLVVGDHIETDVYDPAADAWSQGPEAPSWSTNGEMTQLSDGRLLVAGGSERRGSANETSALFDPATSSWEAGPDMRAPRMGHGVAAIPGGGAVAIGGAEAYYERSSEVEVFHPGRSSRPTLAARHEQPALAGTETTFEVSLFDEDFGAGMRSEAIGFFIDGMNSYAGYEATCAPVTCRTDADGKLEISYRGEYAGTDTVWAWADLNRDGSWGYDEPQLSLEIVWQAVLTRLEVAPLVGAPVGGPAPRELRATLTTHEGDPVNDVTVDFYAGSDHVCSGYTYDGVASCKVLRAKARAIASNDYRAVFVGNERYARSEGKGSVVAP